MVGRFARQSLIEGWNQSTLTSARVLVVGAGTTGNEVIKNLALLGIGHLTIIDMDDVEEVNLSRSVLFRPADLGQCKSVAAARSAIDLNPGTDAIGLRSNVVYGYGNAEYRHFSCVVVTVDNLEARLWANRYSWLCNTPIVDTGVVGFNGSISVHIPPDSACVECSWSESYYENIEERYSCLKIGIDADQPKIPMVITTAAIVGGLAVQEVVRLLADPDYTESKYVAFNGRARSLNAFKVPRSDLCGGHSSTDYDINWDTLEVTVSDHSIDSTIERIKLATGASTVQIETDKPIVTEVGCRSCGTIYEIEPVWLAAYNRQHCSTCGGQLTPQRQTFILHGSRSFREFGIPTNHLLLATHDAHDELTQLWILVR